MKYMLNKVFEALERLKTAPSFMGGTEKYKFAMNSERVLLEDYEIIKQALNELKAIKETEPSEAMECLDRIKAITKVYSIDLFSEFAEDLDTIKQALLKAQEQEKVLEIINKKSVYIHLLQQCGDVESYNNYFITKYGLDEFTERLLLTQEEFDTLKRRLEK